MQEQICTAECIHVILSSVGGTTQRMKHCQIYRVGFYSLESECSGCIIEKCASQCALCTLPSHMRKITLAAGSDCTDLPLPAES